MCTILTVDRFFYQNNKQEVDERIESDAISNDDGWAVVLLGRNRSETVLTQSLELSAVQSAIETVPWTRMFVHSRLATTSTSGIFGCHNFTTVGDGLKVNVENGYWIVQHNGILKSPMARHYMVDSMIIPEMIRSSGIEKTIKYLVEEESYANVFLINPLLGQYIVTRSETNSLYTDQKGNYSTNKVGTIEHPVPNRSSHVHHHFFDKKKPPVYARYENHKEAIAALMAESEMHTKNLAEECRVWGDEVFEIINSLPMFHQACVFLGYLGEKNRKMSETSYGYLSSQQKKWAKTLGIEVARVKKVSVSK